MDKKKLIQILGFILIVLVLAWLMWIMFWQPQDKPYIPGEQPGIDGRLPSIGEGTIPGVVDDGKVDLPDIDTEIIEKISDLSPKERQQVSDIADGGLTRVKRLTDNRIMDISGGENFNYYDTNDNKFYHLTADGEIQSLSDKNFYNVEKVNWADSGNKAIMEYPDGSNILYDFNTGKQNTLPKQMSEFDFSDNENQIAFKWLSDFDFEEDNWLGISSPDGSSVNFIEPMGNNHSDVQVEWSPNSQMVATFREVQGFGEQHIYFVGLHGENFKYLRVPGTQFTGKWMPDGKQILYDVHSDRNGFRPSLWITRADGENIGVGNTPLGLETWVEKCTTSGNSLYCAVPEELPEGAGYVPEVADNISDLIYKIDLETGAKKLLAKPVGNYGGYTVDQIVVSDDGSILYFVDKATGALHSIKLK